MEEHEGATRPFEEGDRVTVEAVGSGTISAIEDGEGEDGRAFIVTLDGEAESPYRAVEGQLTAEETRDPDESVISEPPSVFDELASLQADAKRDEHKTMQLLPGRFKGNLSVRYGRLDPKKRKKKVRKMGKRGITDEAELQYMAEVICESAEAVLIRMADTDNFIEAQKVPESGLGEEPVRYDDRLAKILKVDVPNGASAATICRLVFKNPEALEQHYIELDQWLKEAAPNEDDEDDEEGEEATERPT